MNASHFDKQAQRESTCSLAHGTWRCVGAKIACAGACALMVGQLLLPSVALATECADPVAAADEVAAAPVTPAVAEDAAATTAPAASTAPATDAAPAAQATVEPQQTIPADAVNESSGAALAGQNASGDDNAAMPASNAIMPCGVTDVVGGSDVRVNITVRNNYTDIKKEETIEYVKGIALVDGDQSALDGSALTFIGLGDLIVHAAYDSASNKTTLTLDISKIQRQKEEQKYFTEYKENKSKMTTTYDGSKLTYTGTEPGNIIIGDPDDAFKGDTEATGKPTINEIRDDYYTRTHVYERACLVIPAAESESESISFANVQNTNFNWQLDTGPQATAGVPNYDADKYEITYECWQEFENNEPVAAWYSDNGSHGSLPTITKFKSGKEYVYSLMLKPKDGYSFSDETVVTVNGETVKSSLSGEFLYVPAIKTITMPASSENEALENLNVNDVKTDYAPGEAPRATATILAADADKYEIAYECWEEMDGSDPAELKRVAFWYSDPAKYTPGMKKIDHFEEGKFYMYSVELRLKGDNTVADDCNMNVNGHWAHHIKTDNGVFAPNADNMLCEQPIDEWRAIDVIEINGATTTFKAGDKPVFTAGTPASSDSILQCEFWTGSDGSEVNSVEFWDQNITNHIDAFKPGVTYRYGLYFKPARGFYFTPNTKLKINGVECGYQVGEASEVDPESGCIFTLWLNTNLTFTPEATPTPDPQPTPDPSPTPQPEVKPETKPATTTATTKTVEKAAPTKKGDAVLATTGDTTAMTVAALGIAGATVAAAGLAATKRRKR